MIDSRGAEISVKPAALAAGGTLSVPPAASLGMAMPQCA